MSDFVLTMNDIGERASGDQAGFVPRPKPRSFARGLLFALPLAIAGWALLYWLL